MEARVKSETARRWSKQRTEHHGSGKESRCDEKNPNGHVAYGSSESIRRKKVLFPPAGRSMKRIPFAPLNV